MATPIAIKDLGTDPISQAPKRLVVWQITIDAKSEKVVIVYEIETLSPNGTVLAISNPLSFERYNREIIYYHNGEIITPEVLDSNGQIVTPAVVSDGTQIKLEANMKFNELRNSPTGQQIAGMVQMDINDYPDLEQN